MLRWGVGGRTCIPSNDGGPEGFGDGEGLLGVGVDATGVDGFAGGYGRTLTYLNNSISEKHIDLLIIIGFELPINY